MALHLSLLGLPQLQEGDNRSALPLIKPSYLLVHLALRGHWVSREELTHLLRSGDDEPASLGSLRLLLTRARRLEWAGGTVAEGLETEPRRVRWQVATDVQRFRQAYAERHWAGATDLYLAPLLQGLPTVNLPGVQSWLDDERAELHQMWLNAVAEQQAALLDRGASGEAAQLLRRALSLDPLSEELLQRFVAASQQAGKREDALRAYERFAARLGSELGLKPTQTTLDLIGAVRRTGPPPGEEAPEGAARGASPGPAHSPGPARPLIGRLEQRRALLGARQGVVLLSGEPGQGKTRLLSEVWPQGRWIRCAEGLEQLPYVPLLNAARDHWPDPRDLGPYAADLARFIPELAPEVGQPGSARSGDWSGDLTHDEESYKARLFEAFLRVFAEAGADPQPPAGHRRVLIVDDLQWADSGTLEWLRFAAERGARVYGAFRTGEVGAALKRTLAALGTTLKVIVLGPLSGGEVTALASTAAPVANASVAFFDWLHRSSGGNPLFVLEWLRALSVRDTGDLSGDDWQPPPDHALEALRPPLLLSELALRRIGDLPALDRRVLDVASVLGSGGSALTPSRLARVLELSEWTVSDALVRAGTRGLLRGEGETFAHDLFRHALYSALSQPQRRFLHGKVAQLLEGDLDDLLVAEHAHLADDQTTAARLWFQVARFSFGVRRGFEDEASALYRRILTLEARPPEWYRACAFLAVRERVAGRAGEARRLTEVVVRESSDPLARAMSRAEGANLAYLGGDLAEATQLAQLAVQEAAALDDPGLARDMLLTQANIAHYRGEYHSALHIAQDVVRQQRQEALSHSHCTWLSTLAANLCALGRFEEALGHYREQLETARHLGLRAQQVTASSDIIATLHDLGRIQEGVPLAEAALDLGQFNDTFPLRYHLALAHSRAGQDPGALEHLLEVMRSPSVNMRAHGYALLAEVYANMGRPVEAQQALQDGLTLAEGCDILTARAVVVIAVLQFASGPLLIRAAPLVEALRADPLPAYLEGDFWAALSAREEVAPFESA
ncbi:ATP-binding protein [Deinococcus sp.]|uniref:ATP-binding protein n=1 Tax=Deinococcus sp. TaxID=47478 RepID=UPI003C7CC448